MIDNLTYPGVTPTEDLKNFNKVLKHKMDFIKVDAGYESQEAFDADYRTICPATLEDIAALEIALIAELDKEIDDGASESYCEALEGCKSLILDHTSRFIDALGQRRDKLKDITSRDKIK